MYNSLHTYDDLPSYLTRREKKLQKRLRKTKHNVEAQKQVTKVNLKRITPITDNQSRTFEAFSTDKNILLHGAAGTGKTFIALYLALNSVIMGDSPKPIVILRSVVPSRDMGFLPGNVEEKIAVYESPYHGLCAELTGHPTSYDYFKKNRYIEFSTTSFLRGITFRNNIIIIDEAQNCSGHELNTIMTRIGEGCRVIICADFTQTDLIKSDDRLGFRKFMQIIKAMKSFDHIEFTHDDIVRSDIVKEYIITKDRMNIDL